LVLVPLAALVQRSAMTMPFLRSTETHLFLRPDLAPDRSRAEMSSRMAAGHREAARSVLDDIEHGFRLASGRGDTHGNHI
jgi:hypothetical protein